MATETKQGEKRERTSRTTVGLSDGTVKTLDALIKREVESVRAAGGIGVPPSRSQIVEALVRNAHQAQAA